MALPVPSLFLVTCPGILGISRLVHSSQHQCRMHDGGVRWLQVDTFEAVKNNVYAMLGDLAQDFNGNQMDLLFNKFEACSSLSSRQTDTMKVMNLVQQLAVSDSKVLPGLQSPQILQLGAGCPPTCCWHSHIRSSVPDLITADLLCSTFQHASKPCMRKSMCALFNKKRMGMLHRMQAGQPG